MLTKPCFPSHNILMSEVKQSRARFMLSAQVLFQVDFLLASRFSDNLCFSLLQICLQATDFSWSLCFSESRRLKTLSKEIVCSIIDRVKNRKDLLFMFSNLAMQFESAGLTSVPYTIPHKFLNVKIFSINTVHDA